MGVSKVNYGDTTLIDLTNDSVTAETLKRGETAHGADGELIEGTYEGMELDDLTTSTNDSADADLFVTKENGGLVWVKKSMEKLWNYIWTKLGFFVGTTTKWESMTDTQKSAYKFLWFTDDGETGTAYNIPYNSTNVGDKLDDLSSDLDDIAREVTEDSANKTDLTNINITSGTTNNTGETINSGTFFYYSGTLVRAKANIANGATLTLNTNYEVVTAGGLNKLNTDIATVNSALTPQEIAVGISGMSAVKCGHVVTLNDNNTGAYTAAAGDVLFTLPSELRPYRQVDFLDSYAKKRFVLGTDGTLTVREAISNQMFRFTITYLAS